MKKEWKFLFVMAVLLVAFCLWPVNILAWPVQDSGQTKCYNNTGEIPCPQPGDTFYGQDSNYTINSMIYTKLNASGNDLPDDATSWVMMRDNVSGLIWEGKQSQDNVKNYANPHDADNTYTWYDPNDPYPGTSGNGTDTEDFITALNTANYGGHHDWRMPTVKELTSIINYSTANPGPTINTKYFLNTKKSSYWSSTSIALTNSAWYVYFNDGEGVMGYKGNVAYTRAVRGGQPDLLDHLVINGDGTVTDKDTGLMWQQATVAGSTWQEALDYCEKMDWAGHTDWRLPNIKELRSIIDYSQDYPAIDPVAFPDTNNSYYWSSTTYASSISNAWILHFGSGYDYRYNKSGNYYVRAMRGGQAGSLGHLVILSPYQASSWDTGALMPIRWNTQNLGVNIKISISRQGGKNATFDPIIASTPNDGQFDWTVAGPSVNCVIKIEQADNSANWATEGLFVIINPNDWDTDGLPNAIETAGCTHNTDADTDDDGIMDGNEDANHNGVVDAGETDPCKKDTDGDRLQDGTETGITVGLPGTDTAIFRPDLDPATVTDPVNQDSDGDGLTDGEEDANHNGRLDNGERDPNLRDNLLPADLYVAKGRTALELHDIIEANRNFELALNEDSQHPEANLYYSVTRILALVYQKEFNDILDGFGVDVLGRDIYRWTADLPKDVNGNISLPDDSPTIGAVFTYITNYLMPQIDGALGNLEKLEFDANDHTNPITIASPNILDSDESFEVDYGDVSLYKAFLKGVKALLLIINSYELNVDIDGIVTKINTDSLDVKADIIDAYPSLLNLNDSYISNMASAKATLIDSIDDYLTAVNFINNEDDPQLDDLISINPDPEDIHNEELFRFILSQVQASLQGNVSANFTIELSQFIDLAEFFDNPYNFRDLLNGEGIQTFLKEHILYQVERTLMKLSTVGEDFNQILDPADYPVEAPVEVDYGDVALMKSFLHAASACIKIVCAYDIKVDVYDIANQIEKGTFSINSNLLSGAYPQLLRLIPEHQLGDAKMDVDKAIDFYLAGSDFIRKVETDAQENDFITSEDLDSDMSDEEIKILSNKVKDSLKGPALIPGTEPFIMDLTQFFDEPIHLIEYLPDFAEDNSVVRYTFPDPSFSGVFPEFGPSKWREWLFLDSDGDKIPDNLETGCIKPNDADSDDDGILDGDEDANYNGNKDAGETDPCNADTDNDGIQDGTEMGLTQSDIGLDTVVGLFQPDLDNATTTDPLNSDSDGDGASDGIEDANHNGRIDPGERNPNVKDPVFGEGSATITNPLVPLNSNVIGARTEYAGFGDWDGYRRYIETKGTETVDGVQCIKFLIRGFGNNPDPDIDPEWYYVWMAEDTAHCLWTLKSYDGRYNVTVTHGADGAYLTLPANPVAGQVFSPFEIQVDYKKVIDTGVNMPMLSTGAGPFSGCLEIKAVKSGGTIEETEYYAPLHWVVKIIKAGGAYGWEIAPESCVYTIEPKLKIFTTDGGTGSMGVTIHPDNNTACDWSAISNASWIKVASGSPGEGNGVVAYTVDMNTDAHPRSGTITIAGETYTIYQAGTGGVILWSDDFNGPPYEAWQIVRNEGSNNSANYSNPRCRYEFHIKANGSAAMLYSAVYKFAEDGMFTGRIQKLDSTGNSTASVVLRGDSELKSGYAFVLNYASPGIFLYKVVNNVATLLKSKNVSFDLADVQVRYAAIGENLYAKVWKSEPHDNCAEPAGNNNEPLIWDIVATDSNGFKVGGCGIGGIAGGVYTNDIAYDDVTFTTDLTTMFDSDSDGLSDELESKGCTNPKDADSDDDGITDGDEDANHNGIVDAGETHPCEKDSDHDGIQDGTELGYTLAGIGSGTDQKIFQPDEDNATTTNPLNPDSEGDGLTDGQEDINHNGKVDPIERNPNLNENRLALIALYNSTDGDHWTNNSGWKTPPLAPDGFAMPGTELNWYGVTDAPGSCRVSHINLQNNNLTGSIPPEIGWLSNMIHLSLSSNHLSGSIPSQIEQLSNLGYLFLSSNQLTGNIPDSLANLSNLKWAELHANQLIGSIPPELERLSKLERLLLFSNKLTGNIPPELGKLSNLSWLALGFNQLTGNIPAELGNLTNLGNLELNNNHLEGMIPQELGNPDLTKLQELNLSSNRLSGNIPPELGNLNDLRWLYLNNNQLSGDIPGQLGNLIYLMLLQLSSNQLTGDIPISLQNLVYLNNSESDFRWNALYTNEEALRTFLNSKQMGGDWESTQTISPENPKVTGRENGEATLSWEVIPYTGETGGYRVEYAETQTGPWTIGNSTANKTICTLTQGGLDSSKDNFFRIQTFTNNHLNNQNDLISEYSEICSTDQLDLSAPNTEIISGPSEQAPGCQSSASITYSGSDDLTPVGELQFAWRLDSGSLSEFTGETSQTLVNLTHGPHTFEVIAKDMSGNEDPSPAVSQFTVDLNPPSISNVSCTSSISPAMVKWDTDEAATSQVEYGLSVSYGSTTSLLSDLTITHGALLPGLNPATTYHCRVKSMDACGHEEVSSDFTFTTLAEDVTPPDTSLSGPIYNEKTCNSDVNLCWIGIDNFNAFFELQYSYSLDNGAWTSWASETCHDFIGLTDGLHTIQIKSMDSSGNEDSTPVVWSFYVDSTSPALSNIIFVPRDYTTEINWKTSKPATSQVEYGETSTYGMSSLVDSALAGTHSVTIDNLTPKTTYHFRVKSNDGCKEVVSEDLTFTTADILYPNLKVSQTEMPDTCKSPEKIDFKWLERNDGPGATQGSWVDRVFLSTDNVMDSQDTLLGEITVSDGLAWETERWRTATIDMPSKPAGTYYVIISTDADKQIRETNETDNILIKQIDYLKIKQFTAAPDQIPINITPGQPINGTIDLINLGATDVTGITTSLEGNSPNISIKATPPSVLNGKTVEKVNYTVSASDESVLKVSPVLTFTTAQGENASVTFNITVSPGYANLVTDPGNLETTMVRGSQTVVEFEIINTGAIAVSNLKILPPAADWLSLVTPDSIDSIGPGERIKAELVLTPGESLPLGPYTGNIALSASNASASINFRFTAVSGKTGGLNIIAQDEFTFFADDHPPVANAAVKIKNPYDGFLVAEGVTDINGQFLKNDLPEGYYSLQVSAEKHGTYNGNVLVVPGQIKEIKTFLPRQLVTYTWKVVPVETEDKYVVTLEAVFETHVPAPVVTIEPTMLDLSKLTYDENGTAIVNYTITNHGLIAANSAALNFGEHPAYLLTPLNENLGAIPAMSSMEVPVTVQKLTPEPLSLKATTRDSTMSRAASAASLPCGVSACLKYAYVCKDNKWVWTCVSVITGECPPSSILGSGGGVWWFGGGGGVSGGGGGGGGVVIVTKPSISNPPSIQQSLDCDPSRPTPCSGQDGEACEDDGNQCTDDECRGGICTHPIKPDGTLCEDHWFCKNGNCISFPDNCDFSNSKERCFEGIGNGCNGDAPGVPPFTYTEDCKVHGYYSAGSVAHDNCCVKNPTGYGCSGNWDLKTKTCQKDFYDAALDVLLRLWLPKTWGPYPKGNPGDKTE